MSEYAVNGKFVGESVTGMQRYAIEALSELDKLCNPGELEIVVPEDVDAPIYKNIRVVRYGRKGRNKRIGGLLWEQTAYAWYLRNNRKRGLSFLAIVPMFAPRGIVVAHGVNYKVNPQFFRSLHDRLSRLYHLLNWSVMYRKTDHIVAVSQFSKAEMRKAYNVDPERIEVIGNAWQHMDRIKPSEDVFKRYQYLLPGDYFFSMSSVNENKNFRWIAEVAARNQDDTFAIAGGKSLQGYFEREGIKQPSNLHFLGYVSDEDAKTLMAHCKAFLFPTFYEGFGIPPMEAMACGAQAIVSDTPTMHEVYGDTVHYINPYDTKVELDKLMSEPVESAQMVLNAYSWEKTATELLRVIRKDA